ncbi:MAG: branched-chain amino acid ABC transporter permease [Chloroflexi bacterium]|nr:branched-chain amino acid ABC transporter permease [Chloroflexota bacterium]
MARLVPLLRAVRAWPPKILLAGLRRDNWPLAAALILLVVFPFVGTSYLISLLTEVLVFAIFAMSLDLLLGYTGLPSFGHAAFFGVASYLVGYLSRSFTPNALVILPLVLLGTALTALVIGFFALRTSGLAFLMFTLATAQMLFGIAIKWSKVTGGSDGLAGIPRPTLGVGTAVVKFGTGVQYYFLTLTLFVAAFWLLRRLVHSPFGQTLVGIKSNESRMRALGYNTWRYKMAAFVLAGTFAGLAGYLFTHFNRHAAPENLYWTVSGQVLIMVIIGGTGTLVGPALGAALVRLLPSYASTYTDRWQSLMGLVFILFVLCAPQGILGLLKKSWRRREPRGPENAA